MDFEIGVLFCITNILIEMWIRSDTTRNSIGDDNALFAVMEGFVQSVTLYLRQT